jgi:DNA repair protein RadC
MPDNVVIAHNHPTGCTAPSSDDICVTGRLKQALADIDVPGDFVFQLNAEEYAALRSHFATSKRRTGAEAR